MQSKRLIKPAQKDLLQKAAALLADGVVDRVLGWKKGEFAYEATPGVFRSVEELEKDFLFGEFCGANLSKYLISETKKPGGKILVFLKPCDSYSFNQLLTEHRFIREKVYAVGIPCDGMVDPDLVKQTVYDGFLSAKREDDCLFVETLSGEHESVDRNSVLAERCRCCEKENVAYDELLVCDESAAEMPADDRFSLVEKLEAMSPEERFAFWQGELSRCIRCNACRNVCPACSCEKCVFDNPKSGVEQKAAADSFEEQLFHIIRAFHVAGRCTDCGECFRVCPEKIPLHLLNRKFIHDIDRFYGDYQAGVEVGSRAPLVDYAEGDLEPGEAVNRRKGREDS